MKPLATLIGCLSFFYAWTCLAQGPADQDDCLTVEGYARGVVDVQKAEKSGEPVYFFKLLKPRCAILANAEKDKPVRIDKLDTIQLIPRNADDRSALDRAGKSRTNVYIGAWELDASASKVTVAASSTFSIGEATDRVKTTAGELVVGKETKQPCSKPPFALEPSIDDCRVIRLNGKPFMTAPHIGIEKVYPNQDNPQVLMVWSHPGGNLEGNTYHLVDVTGKAPKIFFSKEGLSSQLKSIENGIEFQSVSGSTKLGDSYLFRYSYTFGSGKLVLKSKTINYSTTPIDKKVRPEDIFSDPELRKPLLAVIGEKHFAEYRKKMDTAENVTLHARRYLFASGCKTHDCCGNETAFVLDVVDKKAWALEESSPTCTPEDRSISLWGKSLPDASPPQKLLGGWLEERGVQWSSVKLFGGR